ncbi:MAG: allophanate hydrolase [Acidimicrobiia bacterium]|nr:allophanate hydrolase [Acidimicrobiia bacterium]
MSHGGSVLGDAVWLARLADDDVAAAVATANGPLAGLTFAVKDNIDVEGLPTTAACPTYGGVAERSATAVSRLVDAGAVYVGKTNMDQFATGLVGTRSPHGTPPNPFDPALVPGGSSSGSAVAVARGDVDVALGTDTAGSGRVPAAMCGIVGFKPAPGEWPADGVVPACKTLDTVSVFTTTIGMALRVDAVVRDAAPIAPAAGAVRVGCAAPPWLAACDDVTLDGLARSLEVLDERGLDRCGIELGALFEAGDLLYDGPWIAERTAVVGDFIDAHPDDVDPVVRDIVLDGRRWSAVDAFRARYRLEELAAEVDQLFGGIDVLVLPTVPMVPTLDAVAADPIGVNRALGRYTNAVNLLGLAVLAVPGVLRADGVPTGLSVIAPPRRWPEIVAVGAALCGEDLSPLRAESAAASGASSRSGGPDRIELAVVGAHLSGFPLNERLTSRGAQFVERTSTAAAYRFHELPGGPPRRPALERVDTGGAAIEVEVWSLDPDGFARLTVEVPPPLAIGTVVLADGRSVKGFVCELGGLTGAVDITASGGWRAHTHS